MPPPFSIWVFAGTCLVLAASVAMFWLHVQRWTHNRLWVALRDWANGHGFKLHRAGRAAVPVPLAGLTLPPPNALVALAGAKTVLLQMDTPASAVQGGSGQPQRWNVLVRELSSAAAATDWPATALRPAAHERSLVDLFGLASFPALLSSDRYTIHGVDSAAARAVAKSMLIALLPHDLGLILYGRRLIVDFSTRPFDGIELSRVLSLVDQLVTHLPALRHT
jgi:hypothetical protein